MNRPKVVYYVAASLDGFIATPDGGVEWLDLVEKPGEDHGYAEFEAGIDALVMGRKTHDFVVSHGSWPYPGKSAVVVTRQVLESPFSEVRFRGDDPVTILGELAEEGHQRVWLVGGGELAQAFLAAGCLDELEVTWIPTTLGQGIPLFGSEGARGVFTLEGVREFPTGAVSVRYCRK